MQDLLVHIYVRALYHLTETEKVLLTVHAARS